MSFIKKTWLARIGVGLNRFRMNNSTDVVLESNPISVTQAGDQLSADNMNNLETRIGNAFDEMAGNLAPIEVSPASTNHAVGTQIVYNGILYKVISAISTDDVLVVGTNISPYPVSSAISDISDTETLDISSYFSSITGLTLHWAKAYKKNNIVSIAVQITLANTNRFDISIPTSVLPSPKSTAIAMATVDWGNDSVTSQYGAIQLSSGNTRLLFRTSSANIKILASATYICA